jgi:hypothetical protein
MPVLDRPTLRLFHSWRLEQTVKCVSARVSIVAPQIGKLVVAAGLHRPPDCRVGLADGKASLAQRSAGLLRG